MDNLHCLLYTSDVEDSKKLISSSIKSISAEQDTEITYDYGQELSSEHMTIKEYEEKIQNTTRAVSYTHLANSKKELKL